MGVTFRGHTGGPVYDFDLLSLGSGPAGQRAAVQAAKAGKRAAIVEKRLRVGGVCVETGTIPSKTLREAVLFYAGVADRDKGEGPVRVEGRPAAEHLLARVTEVVQRECEVMEAQLRRNDDVVLRGEGSFLDPHTVSIDGGSGARKVTAGSIVIAVGTRPATPPGAPVDDEVVVTSDRIRHLMRLPSALIVVGAGVIGMEYASMFAALGVAVTVVEQRPRPLEFLDHEITDELIHQMRKRNVTFRFGETVERVEVAAGPPPRAVLCLTSGKRLVSGLVLYSAGRQGATDGLNLEAAGLEADARGRLTVDGQFRTRVRHIFAAGDVIGYPSLAATSSEQGRLAACHALGLAARPMADHFPIGIYSIPEISMVGAPEHELTARQVP